MANFPPTPEQSEALRLFATGDDLVIEAGAGTGKTSTLCLIAESTGRTGQYIAFNKAIVVEASAKMPRNVTCSTAHSLAYRAVGHKYGARLRGSRRMRSMEIARLLRIDPFVVTFGQDRKVMSPGFLAGLAMRAITRFCQTADPAPTAMHVPYVEGIDLPHPDGSRGWANNRELATILAPALVRGWADLVRLDGMLPYKHEHYLKLWQLTNPTIGADFILFDEAQDANPVLAAIVDAQTHAQRVWVGDSQQAIYEWTGAVNALASFEGNRTHLSQSFRFGPEVAAVANQVLGYLESPLVLKGNENIASVVGPVPTPDVILCRTNAIAVGEVLTRQKAGQSVHLVGGGAEVVAFAKAAGELINGQPTYHPELACFDTWGEVLDYVDHDEQGGELRLMVKLVEEFGVAMIIQALDRMIPEAGADVVVSTAHKAKGREWDSVQIAGDFPGSADEIPADPELRLLYVALTRARRELDHSLVGLFAKPQEAKPETPETTAECVLCGRQDSTVARRDIASVEAVVCDGCVNEVESVH